MSNESSSEGQKLVKDEDRNIVAIAGNVPQASFFSGLEKEVKKILRACQLVRYPGPSYEGPQRAKVVGRNKNAALSQKLKDRCIKFNRAKKKYFAKKIVPGNIKKEIIKNRVKGYGIRLVNRNWKRISVHPFVNFLRVFRRKVPQGCPLNIMRMKGREIWKKMDNERKIPFVQQALRAQRKGYLL